MIVYVESNFVLELAFLQEEYESCLELLRLAESQDIHLVLPAFSIGEPYEVWVRRSKQRRELRDQLSTAIRELSRSRPYQASSHECQAMDPRIFVRPAPSMAPPRLTMAPLF